MEPITTTIRGYTVPNTRYQISDTKYQIPNTKYQIPTTTSNSTPYPLPNIAYRIRSRVLRSYWFWYHPDKLELLIMTGRVPATYWPTGSKMTIWKPHSPANSLDKLSTAGLRLRTRCACGYVVRNIYECYNGCSRHRPLDCARTSHAQQQDQEEWIHISPILRYTLSHQLIRRILVAEK